MVNDGQFGDDIEDAASLVSPDAGAEVPPEQPEAADPQTAMLDALTDRKSTRLNSSHIQKSRMPSSA